jgi:hypothetical protein
MPDEPTPARRRVLFVVGSSRSGASALAGALQALGMHVPPPEVEHDPARPAVKGESQWVVDLHTALLERCHVQVSDARPKAWFRTGKVNTNEETRAELHAWLSHQLQEHDELVVKDPQLTWFLGLWRSAAMRCDAAPTYVTVLRPVTELLGGHRGHDDQQARDLSRTAGWINTSLHAERATRGSARAFVRYADLVADWTRPVYAIGERFGLDAIRKAHTNDLRKVHQFVDPSLHHVQLTWDDVQVPARLRELAQESWVHLDRLADPDGDTPAVQATLDELRVAYGEFYEEAEAITASSSEAAFRIGLEQGHEEAAGGEHRTPHWMRAMVPPAARRGVKRALGRD